MDTANGIIFSTKKGAVDAARSGLFTKLAREITMAAKLGDKNPG